MRTVYSIRSNSVKIAGIDNELSRSDYKALLERLDIEKEYEYLQLFKNASIISDNHVNENIVNQSEDLKDLETQLQVKHAGVINNWIKELNDDAEFVCCSCDRLNKRSNVTKVKFDGCKFNSELWQTLITHIKPCLTNNEQFYVCKYCLKLLNSNKMPPHCILNGLETVPIPRELANLDPLSCQLIQRAKAFQTIIRLGTYTGNVPKYNSLKACKGTMFFLPLPITKTLATLSKHDSLPDPEMYVIINGKPTKGNVVWQQLVDIKKVKRAFNKLKEINWLYKSIEDDTIDEVAKKVMEVCDSASSTMVEKITTDDVASFQAYTIRRLDKKVLTEADIDQYKLLHVREDAMDSRKLHLDVMCFPVLFPNGKFGEHYAREVKITTSDYIKCRLLNKNSRFRKDPQYVFYLLWLTELRQLTAGIFNMLRSGKHQHGLTVQQFLNGVSSSCENVEGNLSTVFNSVRGTKQYWYMRNSELKCMIREWGTPTLFLTFSCAEYESPEIINYIKKVNNVPDNYPSGKLCVEDPISVSRKFSQKFHSFFQTVLIKGQVLGEISHFFWKKEYQARGAPHYHVVVGLRVLLS